VIYNDIKGMTYNLIGGQNMKLPEYKNLDTQHLQRLFDNMSECYKLFWFQAIVNAVKEGKELISYDDLVNEMIASAWYMVSEYK